MLAFELTSVNSLLFGLLVLGAIGLYLALPSGRRLNQRLGMLVLAAAGGLLISLLVHLATRDVYLTLFVVSAVVALFAAVRVITHAKPVYSALYFILLIIAVTALLIRMQAEFLSVALVIVYGGAILVTYLFVIMLAQQSYPAPYDNKAREPLWGCLAGFALLTALAAPLLAPQPVEKTPIPPRTASLVQQAGQPADATGTVEAVGTPLLTTYVVGIEIAGVLLLAAMVGAIAIARRQPGPDPEEGEPC